VSTASNSVDGPYTGAISVNEFKEIVERIRNENISDSEIRRRIAEAALRMNPPGTATDGRTLFFAETGTGISPNKEIFQG